jgi:hypothetical protein
LSVVSRVHGHFAYFGLQRNIRSTIRFVRRL